MSLLILMFIKSFQFLFCAFLIVMLFAFHFLSCNCSIWNVTDLSQIVGYVLMLNTKLGIQSADNYYHDIICHDCVPS